MERPNDLSRLWASFKADIKDARTRKPVLNAKAIEALKARTITTTNNAELDYSVYLSELYFNRPQGHKLEVK